MTDKQTASQLDGTNGLTVGQLREIEAGTEWSHSRTGERYELVDVPTDAVQVRELSSQELVDIPTMEFMEMVESGVLKQQ